MINLNDLKIERGQKKIEKPRRSRRSNSRLLVPSVILLMFLTLVAWAMRDRLIVRRQVTVVPLHVSRLEQQREGTPLFQAAGWVEPRPTATNIAALTEGVVSELLVVEGQSVDAGQPVAKLLDTDAHLSLREAENNLSLKEAELQFAQAELKSANQRFDKPVHLDAQVAESQSVLERLRSERLRLPFQIKASEAQLEYARKDLEGKRAAGEGVSGRTIRLAETELQSATAHFEEVKQKEPTLKREEEALLRKVDALTQQRSLLIEESRQVETAKAKERAAISNRDLALLSVERARLNLDRCVIRSPMTGRIMQLVAQPGMRVMGLEANATRSSNTVVTMYNPQSLQVRVDVRLTDVAMVQPGQPVQVQTAAAKGLINGVVLRPTSSANVQKNTLEVKVELQAPPDYVRPEMLVTATFLALPSSEADSSDKEQQNRLSVPRAFVTTTASGATVWIVDASGTARQRRIQLGSAGNDQLVEVIDGLTLTDKVIASSTEALRDGEPVKVSYQE